MTEGNNKSATAVSRVSASTPRAVAAMAVGVFLVAFLIRLVGIGWGLPNEHRHQSLHPDEPLIMLVADEQPFFKPGFYNYGSLYLTFLKAGAAVGRAYGWIPEGRDVPQWKTDSRITLTGRVMSAAAGAGTVALVFVMLVGVTNLVGAIIGSLALAIAAGHVVHSRFQTTDVTAGFFVGLSLLLILRLFLAEPEGRTRFAAWTGVAAGLAVGTKYAGIVLLPSVWLACYLAQRERFWKNAGVASVCFLGGFLLATPGALVEPEAFWAGFTYEMEHTSEGHGIVFASTPSGFVYHVLNLATAFGLVASMLGLAGIVYAVFQRERWALPMILFLVLYYLLIGRAEVKFMRYVFPLLPVLALGLGYLAGELHRRGGWWRLGVVVIIFAVGFSARAEIGVIRITDLMSKTDPRDMAAEYLRRIADGKTIGFVTDPWFYSPPLFADTGMLGAGNRLAAMAKENPWLVRYIPADGSRKEWDKRLILEAQPDYIVFSSFEFVDHDRISEPEFVAFMETVGNEYELVAVVWGGEVREAQSPADKLVTRAGLRSVITQRYPLVHDMMYIQPTICILKRKQTN